MERRGFIVGAAAAALLAKPSLAGAQGRTKRYIAIANASRPAERLTAEAEPRIATFLGELERLGFKEGANLAVATWTGYGREDLDQMARELVATGPEAILAVGGAVIGPPLKRQTDTIPIVFVGQDPVRYGLVEDLARPGGNVTGFTTGPGREIANKHLQLLVEAVPTARRIAYLNSGDQSELDLPIMGEITDALDVSVVSVLLGEPVTERSYAAAFERIAGSAFDALYVGQSSFNSANASLTGQLSVQYRMPSIGAYAAFARGGGLVTHTTDRIDIYRRAGGYVARVLNGEKPGDLPVQQNGVRLHHQPAHRPRARHHHPAEAADTGDGAD